jgi:hypothetical protein
MRTALSTVSARSAPSAPENIHQTFRDLSFEEHSGNIQGTFEEHSGNIHLLGPACCRLGLDDGLHQCPKLECVRRTKAGRRPLSSLCGPAPTGGGGRPPRGRAYHRGESSPCGPAATGWRTPATEPPPPRRRRTYCGSGTGCVRLWLLTLEG